MLDYKPKPFDLVELAFFWNPRRWVEIVARFGEARAGSSDIRDAIIEVDDEGGHGFLHWHKDLQAWALTDKGKAWVRDFLSPRRLNNARSWSLPEEAATPAPAEKPVVQEDEKPPAEAVAEESPGDELARLVEEQAADDVAG